MTKGIVPPRTPTADILSAASLSRGAWRSYDRLDGLDHDCRCVVADDVGYVWIGSRRNGLSRFDGRRFETFGEADGLPCMHVRCLAVGADGALWVGTEGGGLTRVDSTGFTTYGADHGLGDPRVRCIETGADGTLYVGTREGTFQFDGSTFDALPLPNSNPMPSTRALALDSCGTLWIAADDRGLYRRPAGGTVEDIGGEELRNTAPVCLAEDLAGRVWVGTRHGGLYRRDGESWTRFGGEDGLPEEDISCLRVDGAGTLWIGCRHSGVVRYCDGEFVAIGTGDGSAPNIVHEIAEDREGSLWFACWHGGLSRYRDDVAIVTVDPVQEVMAWGATGLSWASGAHVCRNTEAGVLREHVADQVNSMVLDRHGRMWIGTCYGGVWRREGAGSDDALTLVLRLQPGGVMCLCEDREGRMWVGTDDGALCHADGEWTTYTANDGLADNQVSAILQDRHGHMWFGSNEGGGLTRYDGMSFETFSTADGLVHDGVVAISEDADGVLWISTHGGLSRYDGSTFENTAPGDGLLSSSVKRAFHDSAGRTWIATLGAGVHVMRGADMQVLTTDDGLPSNHVTCVLEEEDGSVLIATYRGICRYTPRVGEGPQAEIVEAGTGRAVSTSMSVTAAEGVGSASFAFRAVTPRTSRVRYRYKLEGHDDDWVQSWDPHAEYSGLPVGSYVFRVEAIDRDLCRSPEPAEVTLNVAQDPRDRLIAGLEATIALRTRELRQTADEADDARRRLAYEERVHDTLLTGTPDAVFVQDTECRFVRLNEATARYLGIDDPEAAIGKTTPELIGPGAGARRLTEDREIMRSAEAVIGAVRPTRRPDGSDGWIMFNKLPVLDSSGEVLGLVGIGRDISDFVRAQERLHEREVVQMALLEAVPDHMFRVTSMGDMRSVVPGGESAGGGGLAAAFPLDDPVSIHLAVAEVLGSGATQARSYTVAEGDERRYFEARYSRIDATEALCLVRDVTEATRTEMALRDSEDQRSQLLQRLMAAQEEERTQIAYELHDQAAQAVASLMFGLRAATLVPTLEEARDQVAQMRELAATVLEDLRELSTSMRPSSLDDLGLLAALSRDAEEMSAGPGATVTLHALNTEGVRLSREVETGLYRVAQRALENARAHSSADAISITVRYHDDRVTLMVEDDGVGFDAEAVLAGPAELRFGFLAMDEHMRAIGGEMDVYSEVGEGAAVVFEVPVDPPA